MKKLLIGLFACVLVAIPVYAEKADYNSSSPDVLNAIDISELSEDELREAYDALRNTYSALFDLWVETKMELDKANAGSSDDSNIEDADNEEGTGIWAVKYYVDEFNLPTENGYVTSEEPLEGTFSNAATTNSLLKVVPLLDEGICFKLYEYGSSLVKSYSAQEYKITILDQNGEKHDMSGWMNKNADRVRLNKEYVVDFYDIISSPGSVSIYLEEIDSPTSYLFTIDDCSHFEETYLQLFDYVPRIYEGKSELDVEMSITAHYSDDKITYLNIETNLPDGTVINAQVERNSASSITFGSDLIFDSGTVKDGKCEIEIDKFMTYGFSIEAYGARIFLSRDKQPIDVQNLIGTNFNSLTGDIGELLKSGKGYIVSFN